MIERIIANMLYLHYPDEQPIRQMRDIYPDFISSWDEEVLGLMMNLIQEAPKTPANALMALMFRAAKPEVVVNELFFLITLNETMTPRN